MHFEREAQRCLVLKSKSRWTPQASVGTHFFPVCPLVMPGGLSLCRSDIAALYAIWLAHGHLDGQHTCVTAHPAQPLSLYMWQQPGPSDRLRDTGDHWPWCTALLLKAGRLSETRFYSCLPLPQSLFRVLN